MKDNYLPYILLVIASGFPLIHKIIPFDYSNINQMYDMWPLTNDYVDYPRSYVYHLCSRISLCLIYLSIYILIDRYKWFFYAFLLIEFILLVEFILTFNHPFIELYSHRVGLTHISVVIKGSILGTLIFKDARKNYS